MGIKDRFALGIFGGTKVEEIAEAAAISAANEVEAALKEVVRDRESKAKRVIVVEQLPDDTYRCTYVGLTARQQLLPMLRAAEKQFRINLNRKSIQMSIESGKLI